MSPQSFLSPQEDPRRKPVAPPDDSSSVPAAPRRRLWLVVLLGVLGALTVAVAVTLWFLAHLDHPWVRSRVERALSAAVGTDVRYERLSLSPFSGLEAEGFVIETPEPLAHHAPELLRVDTLRVPIELGPLLSGDIEVPEVAGGALTVTLVVADDGRTSWSELVWPEPSPDADDADSAPTPLSHSLDVLRDRSVQVGSVRLAPIVVRVVQVTDDSIVTESRLDALGLSSDGIALGDVPEGALQLGPHEDDHAMLTVRDLYASGAEAAVREARLAPSLTARLEHGRSALISLSVDVAEQSLFPELRPIARLLRLEARARFEPDQARTAVELTELSLLDSMLTAETSAVVGDDYVAVIDGEGAAELPSLPWVVPWLYIDDLSSRFEVSALKVEPDGVTDGQATFDGALDAVRYALGPAAYEVRAARWNGTLGAPHSSSRTLGALDLETSAAHVSLEERGVHRTSLDGLATELALQSVGPGDTGMLGLQGTGSLRGSIARVSVDAGTRVRARDASLDLQVDLARQRVEGRVPVAWLAFRLPRTQRVVMRRPKLAVAARQPFRWMRDDGTPSIEVDASAGRVSFGDDHFRAKGWALDVHRTRPHRYTVRSRVRADRVSWGTFRKAHESSLAIDAEVDTAARSLDATAGLSIAGGAQTDLALSASYDAPVARYVLDVSGSGAGPLLGWLVFDDGGKPEDELDVQIQSRGRFRGLVRESRDGYLVLSDEPLRTLRGEHESKLFIRRASLVRDGIRHELSGLRIEARSEHEAPGRGRLDAELRFDELRFGEAGWELTTRDYAHRLNAAYAALHGAPSFTIQTRGEIGEMRQPYLRQYPLENATFGADVDVDDTEVIAVRQAFFRNPAGGTRFEARAAYEGQQSGLLEAEVCTVGIEGCPEIASMYGRESAMITGAFEQDFSFWKSTEDTQSAGSLVMPFTIESGDLSTYRVVAAAELRDVVLELPQYGLLIDDLDALIPVEQELATRPRFFVVPTSQANAIAQKRFFDLYPFTKTDSFFTVDRIQLGRETLGPVAANLQVVGATLAMDQLHAAYRGGFITGQVLGDLSRDDPKVVFRGNVTGVEATDGKGVLDANVAMTFVPTTLILEGKAQVVRISKDHLYEIIDVLDPYHEDEDLNRVRLGLKFGYPKFVLLKMDEGLMNAKIDLGGLAGAVRIDEIRGIPVTPFIEQYVQPYIERLLSPTAAARAMIIENEGT